MLKPVRQRGFSLVELMIATTLGLLLVAGSLLMLTELLKHSREALEQAHLRQTMTTIGAIITAELRRAGYSGHHPSPGPDDGDSGYLPVHIPDTTPEGSCLLYSLDQDSNSSDGIPKDSDQSGLRLANTTLQVKTSDPTCGNGTCDTCDSGHWLAVTDPGTIRISNLEFSAEHRVRLNASGDRGIEVRSIRTKIDAERVDNPAIAHHLETVTLLPNDRHW